MKVCAVSHDCRVTRQQCVACWVGCLFLVSRRTHASNVRRHCSDRSPTTICVTDQHFTMAMFLLTTYGCLGSVRVTARHRVATRTVAFAISICTPLGPSRSPTLHPISTYRLSNYDVLCVCMVFVDDGVFHNEPYRTESHGVAPGIYSSARTAFTLRVIPDQRVVVFHIHDRT